MDADGDDPENLTKEMRGMAFFPQWSPDGTRIAFSSDQEGDFDIWVMNADGSNKINLTGSS
jgi:TolB protein